MYMCVNIYVYVLHYTLLIFVVLYYSRLQHIKIFCDILCLIILLYIISLFLYRIIAYCIILYHIISYDNVLCQIYMFKKCLENAFAISVFCLFGNRINHAKSA